MIIVKDNIWITYKVRMISERKFIRYHYFSHISLSYISVLLIFGEIFTEYLSRLIPGFKEILIVLTILLFAVSLIIYGFQFLEKASKHRSCYLKLQSLYRNFDSTEEPEKKYELILDLYPNHRTSDYNDFIVESKFLYGKDVFIDGKKIECTCLMVIGKLFRVLSGLVVFACLLIPIFIFIIKFFNLDT